MEFELVRQTVFRFPGEALDYRTTVQGVTRGDELAFAPCIATLGELLTPSGSE